LRESVGQFWPDALAQVLQWNRGVMTEVMAANTTGGDGWMYEYFGKGI